MRCMGGHKAGEVASQSVTNELQNVLKKKTIEIHQAESWLRSNIKDINFLYNYAQEHPAYNGMGTTLCDCL